jgi:hypothetical protein
MRPSARLALAALLLVACGKAADQSVTDPNFPNSVLVVLPAGHATAATALIANGPLGKTLVVRGADANADGTPDTPSGFVRLISMPNGTYTAALALASGATTGCTSTFVVTAGATTLATTVGQPCATSDVVVDAGELVVGFAGDGPNHVFTLVAK